MPPSTRASLSAIASSFCAMIGRYAGKQRKQSAILSAMRSRTARRSISHKAFVSCVPMPEARDYLIKENEVAAWKQ